MASSDRQPEGVSMEEFDGKQAELVEKLSEISTSMRQCADIVDSFTRIVRQFSFRPIIHEATVHRQPLGLAHSRGSSSAPPERSNPSSGNARISVSSPSFLHGTEGGYRRPSQSYGVGSMLPPVVPTFHAAGLPTAPTPSSSTHTASGPSSYPLHRPSSSASGAGSGGLYETGGPTYHAVDVVLSASERRASIAKQGKRKRTQPEEVDELGDESEVDTGVEGSPGVETHRGTSETDQATRRSTKHPAEDLEETLSTRVFSSKGQAVARSARARTRSEDRLAEPAPGPSIVVFSSGAGASKTRSLQVRAAQTSTRNRKEKKPRDPNAPKQPPPAYIVYQNEVRETMRARFPTHSPTELVKEIAATWKTLPNSERQRYKNYASIEKGRWVTELAAYQATLPKSDEAQPGKSSESTFLATVAVSDSPPASSPRQSPGLSDTDTDPRKLRRVTSQDIPSSAISYGYRAPNRASASFSGTVAAGVSSLLPSGESRSGRSSATQEYAGHAQEQPSRPERSLSRPGFISPVGFYGHATQMSVPSPPASRSHFHGYLEPRGSSTRLPSFDSLRLGHSLQSSAREPSPGPTRDRSETEGEPVPKRQRTRTNPPTEEEEDGGPSRSAHEEREVE